MSKSDFSQVHHCLPLNLYPGTFICLDVRLPGRSFKCMPNYLKHSYITP